VLRPLGRVRRHRSFIAAASSLAIVALAASLRPASAGPPFATDDPVPTDYRNWEIYAGTQYENDGRSGTSWSAPFAEFNYGAMPNVQVSFSTQLYERDTGDAPVAGLGQTEFGIKTRFVQESGSRPQISFYPSVTFPDSPGAHAVVLLPIWMQKSTGPWTAFGGGGVYLNDGPGQRVYTFAGAALERTLSSRVTLGGELYHESPATLGSAETTAANLGAIVAVGAYHAILFSAGRAFDPTKTLTAYASYEFALGPGAGR
jgi:hypothetical protein